MRDRILNLHRDLVFVAAREQAKQTRGLLHNIEIRNHCKRDPVLIASRELFASEVSPEVGLYGGDLGYQPDNFPNDQQWCEHCFLGLGLPATYILQPESNLHEIHHGHHGRTSIELSRCRHGTES